MPIENGITQSVTDMRGETSLQEPIESGWNLVCLVSLVFLLRIPSRQDAKNARELEEPGMDRQDAGSAGESGFDTKTQKQGARRREFQSADIELQSAG
jgi:hypothetical protein